MIDPIFLMEIVIGLLVLSLLAQALSHYFQAPFIIFLLIEGIIVGPEVLNLLNPALYSDVLSAIVAICVSVIVFDGGLQIDLKQLRGVKESVLGLSTIGVLITFLGITILTSLLINIPLQIAALFGALVTATGPSVVGPIIRNINVCHKVGKILEFESVLNDAASVILTAMVFEWITAELSRIGCSNFYSSKAWDRANDRNLKWAYSQLVFYQRYIHRQKDCKVGYSYLSLCLLCIVRTYRQ